MENICQFYLFRKENRPEIKIIRTDSKQNNKYLPPIFYERTALGVYLVGKRTGIKIRGLMNTNFLCFLATLCPNIILTTFSSLAFILTRVIHRLVLVVK